MYPGKASRMEQTRIGLTTTITPLTDDVVISNTTSTTVLATITPPFAGFSGILILTNDSGNNITTVTTGNIIIARTIPVQLPVIFVFSHTLNKWYVGAIS